MKQPSSQLPDMSGACLVVWLLLGSVLDVNLLTGGLDPASVSLYKNAELSPGTVDLDVDQWEKGEFPTAWLWQFAPLPPAPPNLVEGWIAAPCRNVSTLRARAPPQLVS